MSSVVKKQIVQLQFYLHTVNLFVVLNEDPSPDWANLGFSANYDCLFEQHPITIADTKLSQKPLYEVTFDVLQRYVSRKCNDMH